MTALAGLRVLDVSNSGAGSLAAALLADFEADVIKLVDSDPRSTIGPNNALADWLVWNRGKRIAVIDPNADANRSALRGLAADADLIVADSADSLTRLGLDQSADANQVVLLVPSYDESTAPWVNGQESPELLDAITGLGSFQTSYTGWPVMAAYPFLRYAHAAWAATCGLAALVERLSSRRGQHVVVTGLHAANAFGTGCFTRPEFEPDIDRAIGPGGLNPLYTRYRARDGEWIFFGGLGPKFVDLMIKTLQLEDVLADPRIGGDSARLWHIDNSSWVRARVQSLVDTAPSAHWIEVFEAADIPCSVLLDRHAWARSPQMTAMGQLVRVNDPILGEVEMPGPPVDSAVTPAQIRASSKPTSVTTIGWLPVNLAVVSPTRRTDIERDGRGPLVGYSAAVLGAFVAGPYVGPLLAELGMDVAKVEPATGDPWRIQGIAVNRGVKSIAVNLADRNAHQAMLKVLTGCDVIVDNFRLGVMNRLGIAHGQLSSVNPGIVTVGVTAYGERGPLAPKPGYDPVLQAASGIMSAQGGDAEPVIYSMPPNDLTTAILGAFASVLALFHRERTGKGQHISTSLGTTAIYLQAPDILQFAGRSPGRWGGEDFRGQSAAEGVYQVRDGWVRIQTPRIDADAWVSAGLRIDAEVLARDPWVAVAAALADIPRTRALEMLFSAGVPAVAARRLAEVATDPVLHAKKYLGWTPMADGRRMATVNRLARFSRTPQTEYFLPPGLGQHSRQVLITGGISPIDIDRLVAAGAVADGPPMQVVHLPAYR